jgi:translation initiation factor eIF-2B subunit beta
MAMKTLFILSLHVKSNDWNNARQLISDIKDIGITVKKADPSECVAVNMILRALKIIRDELNQEETGSLEMMDIMSSSIEEEEDYSSRNLNRESILGYFEEWEAEIEVSASNIAKEALKHIVNNEVILTLGYSKTVESFVKKAASKRSFEVIIAEGGPFCHGHDLAISLMKNDIKVTVIPDSAVMTVVSRVTKVIIGTHSVTANGGLKAVCGSYALALSAKHHSLPLIVLCAMFKYTPSFSSFDKVLSPLDIHEKSDRVQVINPVFDYVPPELVTVFIAGEKEGHSPSYLYHKLSTMYHRKDYLE